MIEVAAKKKHGCGTSLKGHDNVWYVGKDDTLIADWWQVVHEPNHKFNIERDCGQLGNIEVAGVKYKPSGPYARAYTICQKCAQKLGVLW